MRGLIKKILKESEDDFGWVEDIRLESNIEIGDVFYIVDEGRGHKIHPIDYRPKNVRYVLYVDKMVDHGKTIYMTTQLCNPHDMTYNKEDYTKNSPKCTDYGYDDRDDYPIDYKEVLKLINQQYWRRL